MPSNRRRSDRPVIFDAEEKERLRAFITQDKRTRRLQWEEVVLELGYNCSAQTVREAMASMGYHKRLPARSKWLYPTTLVFVTLLEEDLISYSNIFHTQPTPLIKF